MPDRYRRQSPLAHLGLVARASEDQSAEAGVVMAECPFCAQTGLRGDGSLARFGNAVKTVLGIAPPTEPNTVTGPEDFADGARILWLGPDEWLIVGGDVDAEPSGALRLALSDRHAAVVDVSDGRAVIALSGPNARDVLAKGCPLDLHPRAFGPGRCAQTVLAKAHVILHQIDASPSYEIYVHRSFADYLWSWLEDAAGEFGVRISNSRSDRNGLLGGRVTP
ncbi:MAG: hypothetical protein KIT00_01450 [Rhodospirillales bacterium]|nr:hypothetical protein [Rhodospirillales bacterium]